MDKKGRHFCEKITESAAQIELLVEQINEYISVKEYHLTIKELDFLEICQSATGEEYTVV